jgi:hypothetical protein
LEDMRCSKFERPTSCLNKSATVKESFLCRLNSGQISDIRVSYDKCPRSTSIAITMPDIVLELENMLIILSESKSL